MNTLRTFLICVGSVAFASNVHGATLLLDDFSSSGFSLASGGTTSDVSSHVTPLTDQRIVSGVGPPNWTATLASGELLYTVDQLSPSPGRNFINLNYSSLSGSFSILGYSAFAVDLTNIVGSGEFIVFVDGAPGADIRIPISSSGTVISPFTNLDTTQSLDSLTQINFDFRALSEDFFVTVDNVRLVPEPSSMLMIGLASLLTTFRRRRTRSQMQNKTQQGNQPPATSRKL